MRVRQHPRLDIAGYASRALRIFPKADSAVFRKSVYGSVVLLLLLIAAVALAISTGPVEIPLPKSLRAIFAAMGGESSATVTSTQQAVIEQVRMPRVIMALSVGMALALAGTIMQAVFRNPLADPGIIGTSAGGALGAVIMIALGATGSIFLIPAASIIGSSLALSTVFVIAYVGGRMSVASLLLSGIAMGSLLGALVSVTILMTGDFTAQREMIFWLAGGFEGTTWDSIQIILPIVLIGGIFAVISSRDLNLLLLGDDEARSLGVNVTVFRITIVILAAVLTGVAVAFTGIISFVGLVVPHAVRLLTGPDHRHVVLLSALGGALFVLLADTAARTIISPAELRVGIITAVIGAPMFISLLLSGRANRSSL